MEIKGLENTLASPRVSSIRLHWPSSPLLDVPCKSSATNIVTTMNQQSFKSFINWVEWWTSLETFKLKWLGRFPSSFQLYYNGRHDILESCNKEE